MGGSTVEGPVVVVVAVDVVVTAVVVWAVVPGVADVVGAAAGVVATGPWCAP